MVHPLDRSDTPEGLGAPRRECGARAGIQNTLGSLELSIKFGPQAAPRILEGIGSRGLHPFAQNPPEKVEVGPGTRDLIDEGLRSAVDLHPRSDARGEDLHPILCLNAEELPRSGFGGVLGQGDGEANRYDLGRDSMKDRDLGAARQIDPFIRVESGDSARRALEGDEEEREEGDPGDQGRAPTTTKFIGLTGRSFTRTS